VTLTRQLASRLRRKLGCARRAAPIDIAAMKRFAWLAAASGVLFVALLAMSNLLPTAAPHVEDSPATVAVYFTQHRDTFLVALYLQGFSVIPLLLFAAGLRQRFSAGAATVWPDLAFVAAGLTAAVSLAVAPFWAALAYRTATRASDEVITVMFDLGNLGYNLIGFPFALFAAAASLAMNAPERRWRWLRAIGFTVAAGQLLAAGSLDRGGPFAPGGTIFLVTFIQFSLWMVGTAVSLAIDAWIAPEPTA
jgi:hypothetical protein